MKLLLISGLILLAANACRAVTIHSVTVPPIYELKEDGERLILDCDFTVNASDTGFVLKWLHNTVNIYQWIPSKIPFALSTFKGRVDLNYTTSEERFKKHSALVITKPLLSDSGNYSCSVHTFQGSDKKSAEMQIIDPEDAIELSYNIDQTEETVNVTCNVQNIFPLPDVKLLFDDEERDFLTKINTKQEDELYDITLTAQLRKSDIKDESPVSCVVQIPKSNYIKKETITYDDPKQSATTKKSILGELTKFVQSDGATNENSAFALKSAYLLVVISTLLVTVSWRY